jgi:hypothetical protein
MGWAAGFEPELVKLSALARYLLSYSLPRLRAIPALYNELFPNF